MIVDLFVWQLKFENFAPLLRHGEGIRVCLILLAWNSENEESVEYCFQQVLIFIFSQSLWNDGVSTHVGEPGRLLKVANWTSIQVGLELLLSFHLGICESKYSCWWFCWYRPCPRCAQQLAYFDWCWTESRLSSANIWHGYSRSLKKGQKGK